MIDVGCAEGYYAVGLARMMPGVTVHAFDSQAKARAACAELAARNGVADRIVIGERFEPDGFEAFKGRRCLVLVDIEGAEDLQLRSRALGDEEKVLAGSYDEVQAQVRELLLRIPNLPHPDVPDGTSDADNPVVVGPVNRPRTQRPDRHAGRDA